MSDRHPSYAKALEYFNEPVIDYLNVVRMVGWGRDAFDAYYIFAVPYPHDRGAKDGLVRTSVVGGFGSLRRIKTDSDATWDGRLYERLDKWLETNGAPKAAEFLLEDHPQNDYGSREIIPATRWQRVAR